MVKNMMTRNLLQAIRKSLGRYIAIAVIIALGAGMFVGLRSTKMDMVATGQEYIDRQNMFDLRLIAGYGWGDPELEQIRGLDGIVDAEGVYYTDLIINRGEDGEGSVFRFYTLPETVDQLVLLEGRMPQAKDECLADGFRNGRGALGTVLTAAEDNAEDSLEKLNTKTFTVVGIVSTPLYMDMNRGNTSVGSGSISNYYYVPRTAFDTDYYTEIHVTIPGEHAIYSQEYNDTLSQWKDTLKLQAEPIAQQRLENLRADALDAYAEGKQEYEDGLREYEEEKADAEQKLEDARLELEDAEETIRKSEQDLIDGEKKLQDGWITYYRSKEELLAAKEELEAAKQALPEEILNEVTAKAEELRKLMAESDLVDDEIVSAAAELSQVSAYIYSFENGLVEATRQEREEAYARRDALTAQLAEKEISRDTIENAINQIDPGILSQAEELLAGLQQLQDAEEQIAQGEQELIDGENMLRYQGWVIAEGKKKLEEGKVDYEKGKQEYLDARKEADEKFAEAEQKLADAAEELADAERKIGDMTENPLYVLDRSTNMGYNSLDSSSDIVAGVSKVFPVFFLLVAALVCITTMTRMVDEERTQIGTLKALGYSNAAIMSKYLIYAGSSAVLGCALGVTLGSIGFPAVLWEAYKIMIFITPRITIRFDWALALGVLVMYTSAMLAVTWYCCKKALQEVPAELIRPKAPDAGKQLLMERFRFWESLSFLNKVAIRNIFRYRQRLAMMLLGIGGCTALLMTGFGLRDSISKIVDVQFREVMHYDLEVYFREDCSEAVQDAFRETMAPYADEVMFFNQISGEISMEFQTRDIYLISAAEEIGNFWDFHAGKKPLSMPKVNEVYLSAGIADLIDISVGDNVVIRNPDMEELHLLVSGIYDNHVYNYAIILPETMEAQWGRTPEKQMAFVSVRDGADPNHAGAAASGMSEVMNVTVSEQQADMVAHMMKALDLVVILVVFCAGLLAAIVLYNLTNINITERIREIATIKVLGFNALETAMYVFKENLVLSIMGTFFGIPLGKLLLDFVISQIRIDLIWIKARLEWPSLVISIVLTICMAVVVDFIFYFRLEKINMAEALKSVE